MNKKRMDYDSIKTDLIEAIIGKNEIELIVDEEKFHDIDYSDLALISIQYPDDSDDMSEVHKRFATALSLKFWDIEEDLCQYKTLTDEQASKIADFIIENKNRRFLIHCEAGQSRSAGAGLAVEAIIKYNGDKLMYGQSKSEIKDFWRYTPNYTVYDKVVDAFNKRNIQLFKYQCKECQIRFYKYLTSSKDGNLCPHCYKEQS